MAIRIKNWAHFQHFKDRRPPWVKLYRDLLDDMEWHELEPEAAKALVSLWLIASESDGALPDIKRLSFRLRTSEKKTLDIISKLSHWLEQDDIKPISPRYQDDPLETERETETEKRQKREKAEQRASAFEAFWKAYPKKEAKQDALAAWAKVTAPVGLLLSAIAVKRASEEWTKAKGQFVPLPATWLRGKRWEDVGVTAEALVDPDSRSVVEAEGISKGYGPWDEMREQWPSYKSRVRASNQPQGVH